MTLNAVRHLERVDAQSPSEKVQLSWRLVGWRHILASRTIGLIPVLVYRQQRSIFSVLINDASVKAFIMWRLESWQHLFLACLA